MSGVGEGATPLMYACQQSQEKKVLDIINKKPSSARETDRTKKTPLHYCAENFNTNCAEALLRVAPDTLNAGDEDGYSPLHLAVIAGNKPLIQILLSRGADVNSLDHEGHSVVHWATVCGEQEALDMVLRAGANISTADMHGGYPLHYAAQMCGPGADMRGDSRAAVNILRTILSFGADVDERDKDERQPILWAASADSQSRDPGARFASSGSAEAILTLVKAGAKVEAADKDGLTALHCAASRGHTDCLETLVALCGAYVDTIDVNGCTALFYSTTLGHADATQLLLNLGAEPNRQDRKGRTPAHCGAAKGQLETLRILLAGGANLWLRNVKGDLTLHEAVASGRRELVQWLLNQRPDVVNVANNDGKCPIHVAAINNNIEMVKILLDATSFVNPVLRSNKGVMMTPLDAALHRGHRSCAKFLQLHGGVPRSKLSDTTAALRGPAPTREVHLDELITEQHSVPLPTHYNYTARSNLTDSQMQIRVGESEAAIQHVERIQVPICQHYEHHFAIESSDLGRQRRRRRRRRSERRKGGSFVEEDSNEDELSPDSSPRSHRNPTRHRPDTTKKSRKRSSKETVNNKDREDSDNEDMNNFEQARDSDEASDDYEEPGRHKTKVGPPGSADDKIVRDKRSKHSLALEKTPGLKSKLKADFGKKKSIDTEKISLEEAVSLESKRASKNGLDKDVPMKMVENSADLKPGSAPTTASVKVDFILDSSEPPVECGKGNSSKVSEEKTETDYGEGTITQTNVVLNDDFKSKEVGSSTLNWEKLEELSTNILAETVQESNKIGDLLATTVNKAMVAGANKSEVEGSSVSGANTGEQPNIQSDSSIEQENQEVAKIVEVEADVHQVALETDVEQIEFEEEKGVETTKTAESGVSKESNADNIFGQEQMEIKEVPLYDSEYGVDTGKPDTKETIDVRSKKGLLGILDEDDMEVAINRRFDVSGTGEESFTPMRARRQSLVFGELVGREDIDEIMVETRKRGRRKSEGERFSETHRRRGSLFTRTDSEEREERALKLSDVDTVIKGVTSDEPEAISASVGDESGGSGRHEDSSAMPDSGIEPSPRHSRRTPSASPRRRVSRLCRKGRGTEQTVPPVSVTRAVQNTIRKYHLERKIFYQLLELKRLQIRAGRANEHVLVKRLVDEYQRACQIAGLQQYSGIYSFRQFERFLYDQLNTLQTGAQIVIPQLKPSDDIENLSAILKRTRVELLDDALDNPVICTKGTHRCKHATHAYTGIPCAAYITKLNHHTMPKDKRAGFLPLIEPAVDQRSSSRRGSDRPVTLELVHGREKQVISLPTDRLDRSKRYYVTFTIKKGDPTPPKSGSPVGDQPA